MARQLGSNEALEQAGTSEKTKEQGWGSGGCLAHLAKEVKKLTAHLPEWAERPIPHYLYRIALADKSAKTYFERMLRTKGIFQSGTPPCHDLIRDVMRWSSLLDDLVMRDKVDFLSSTAVELVVRRLCGVELALGPVNSEATLYRANWKAAEAVELPIEDAAFHAPIRRACAEATKATARRNRLQKLSKKFAGVGALTWSALCTKMECHLDTDFGSDG
jgi:hypothetical protein